MVDSILSVDDCKEILEKYYNSSLKYVSHKIIPFSETVEGFMGEHYNLEITFTNIKNEEEILKLFIKTKPIDNQAQLDILERVPVFKKEIFLYDFLFKEFEKYGFDISFAAKSYYCIPNKTMVMDNIKEHNFVLHPRNQKFDLSEIKCVLKSLALYHGAGFAYERIKSKELGRHYTLGTEYPEEFVEIFFTLYIKESNKTFWNANFILLETLIDVLPKDENYKNLFKSMLKEAKICSSFNQDFNLPKTCGHGDLWSNNMMFKYKNTTAIESKLLDFQLIRYNCPSLDVIHVIHSNTSAEFRTYYLQELYEYYYETLSEILTKYGFNILDIMSKEDYYKSIEIFRHEVMVEVAVINAIIYLPKDELTKSVKNDKSVDYVFFGKNERCIEAFKNDPVFNKVMSESLYDLYDALVIRLNK